MHLSNVVSSRFPPRNELKLAFLVCAFPVAVWSWVIFIYDLPSFLRSMRVDQILSVFAYVQVVSVIESILLFLIVTLLALLLPRRLFLSNYLPQVTLLVLTFSFWAIGIHLHQEQIALGSSMDNQYLPYYWSALWVLVFLVLAILARYISRINSFLVSFIDRLAFVSSVYLFFAVVSLPVVIVRNLV